MAFQLLLCDECYKNDYTDWTDWTDNKESGKTKHAHMEINENATKNKHKLETA
jgi:hypothetical protein